MSKKSFLILLIFLQLILFSCARQPVARLDIIGGPTEWNYGRAIFTQSKDDLQTRISFETSTYEYLIFNVEIINHQDSSFLILPTTAYLSDHRGNVYQNAVNPEEKLLKEDIKKVKEKAIERGQAISDIIVATTELVDVFDEDRRNNDFYYYKAGKNKPNSAVVQPSYWADESLRKTDLYPDHMISGQILFKRMDEVPDFHLNLVVNETTFVVKYKQLLL